MCYPVHGLARLTPLLLTLTLLFLTSLTFAVAVGDQVEIKSTHQAVVPLHAEPRGMHDFQRVSDGTKATVIDVAQEGRWLKRSLPDGRTGWMTSR